MKEKQEKLNEEQEDKAIRKKKSGKARGDPEAILH